MDATPDVPEINAKTGVIQHKDDTIAASKPAPINFFLFSYRF